MVNMTDTDPPVVSQVRINNGASTALITNVSVSVTASDPSGISTRCASNNNVTALACSPWVPFSTPFYHSLAAGADGPRTVYLFLNDTKGNVMQTPATVGRIERDNMQAQRERGGAWQANGRIPTYTHLHNNTQPTHTTTGEHHVRR